MPIETSDRVYGWKAIAAELGVSVSQARKLADPRRRFMMPVRFGPRGIYITREQLDMWWKHYDAPYGLHRELSGRPG